MLLPASSALAEDGHDLWLRYVPVEPARQAGYRAQATELVVDARTPTGRATRVRVGGRAVTVLHGSLTPGP